MNKDRITYWVGNFYNNKHFYNIQLEEMKYLGVKEDNLYILLDGVVISKVKI